MATDHKPMTPKDILKDIEAYLTDINSGTDTDLSKERADVMQYYDGDLPLKQNEGSSGYVSLDVYDNVESAKAVILEAFSGNTGIGQFTPQNGEDVVPSRVATQFTDYVIFRQNSGYQLFQEMIHDGLVARNGVSKTVWAEARESWEEEFEDFSDEEFAKLLQDPDVDIQDVNIDPDTELYYGDLVRFKNKAQVEITVVPPEEFIIPPHVTDLHGTPFCAHKTIKRRDELIKEGYDKKKVYAAYDEVNRLEETEKIQRFSKMGSSSVAGDEGIEATQELYLYECYLYMDKEGSGVAHLYKVIKLGSEILDCEPVQKHPFDSFTPLPVSHSWYGNNFASKIIATQKAKTVLTRGILDHTVMTNNPRYEVVKGTLQRPSELMDNRKGGIVNVNRPQGITPLMQAPLNPFVYQTIQLLDQDLEDTTGISRLSQGINKDAISKQNSADMVESLAGRADKRQKIMARNFAEYFKCLCLRVYELVIENEDQEKVMEVAGEFQEVNPQTWKKRQDFTIDLNLGYNDKEREAAQWNNLHQTLSQDPTMATQYTPDKKIRVLSKVFEQFGIKNIEEYITPPEQMPEPKPDPLAVAEMELKQIEAQNRQTEMQVRQGELQLKQAEMAFDQGMTVKKFMAEFELKTRTEDRKDEEFDHKVFVDTEELEILEKAEDVRGIASPTG